MNKWSHCATSKKFLCKVEGTKYKVDEKIGTGAYGMIFSAIELSTGKIVAIKVVGVANPIIKQCLEKEIQIMKILEGNKNILSLRDCYSFTYRISAIKKMKFAVLIMDKLDGDLMDYIIQKGKLKEEEAKKLFYQIVAGVKQCHSNGVVHLDIKPDNVLLKFRPEIEEDNLSSLFLQLDKKVEEETSQRNFELKLCDFGFAQYSDDLNMTKLVGTQEYLSPEIRFHASETLPSSFEAEKSDIWSLGVTLFCMLTGYFPYVYENNQMFSANFEVLLQNNDGDLCMDLLEKMFHPNPEDRISIHEVMSHPWLKSVEADHTTLNMKRKSKSTPVLKSASRPTISSKFQKTLQFVTSHIV